MKPFHIKKQLVLTRSSAFQNPESQVDFHWYNGSSYTHLHGDYYELIVIIDGEFSHEYMGKTITLSRGDTVLINPNRFHTPTSEQQKSLLANFSISIEGFHLLTNSHCEDTYKNLIEHSGEPVTLTQTEVEYLVSALNKTYSVSFEQPKNVDFYHISILHWLLGIMNLSYTEQSSATQNSYPDWLKNFLIKLNSPEVFCLSLSEIYALSSYSQSRFIHLFTKYVGKTPVQYITDLKINYAKNLLTKTNFSILEISNILNYSSLSYFMTLFKKMTSFTPSEYRQRFYINTIV